MRPLIIVALLPLCARAGDAGYQIRTLSEVEVLKTYTDVLKDAFHFADREWKTSQFNSDAGYWGDGVSRGNEGIRAVSGMVLASAALVKYDESLSKDERSEILNKATAALRYVTATHITGTQKCPDGKPWGATPKFGGESWQSGMWTGMFAFGAWLIWDKLDPPLQQAVERVIAWEDDILADREPPSGMSLDTKAEENAWEVPCLVLGELMFPTHPHAAKRHETAIKYMLNTLSTESDVHDTHIIDGRAINQWVKGANLYPDYTLENHNFFHPSYVGCSCYFLTQAAMYYTYAGRPIPEADSHHLQDTWRMFQAIILPWGEAAYPQGMDWELHSLPFTNLYAALGTHFQDSYAARMEQSTLQFMRAWQKMRGGSLTFPGSRLGFTRHSINAEQAAYGFVAHKVFGPSVTPMSSSNAAAKAAGVYDYPYVDFIAHRTAKKFVSISWKNKITGLIIPLGEGHEENPDFTTPIPNGLIGTFELSPRSNGKTSVIDHVRRKTDDGFETSGTLLREGGALKQKLRIRSIGEQAVVYEDRITAVSDVTVSGERGVPVGIENDEITLGHRTVFDAGGAHRIDWRPADRNRQKPYPAVALSGSWANVDDRLGVVMLAGSGITYQQASDYSRGISVCSDILYGSFSNRPRTFKAGEEIAHRVAVFFVEVTAQKTSALARSCQIDANAGGQVLHFTQPDGSETRVRLF